MNKIQQACQRLGGVNATARLLGVKPPSVSEWIATNKVPPLRAIQIERLTSKEFTIDDLIVIPDAESKSISTNQKQVA